MALVLFDSNILIDNLQGHLAAALEILQHEDAAISSVSWIEVACQMDQAGRRSFNAFLSGAGIEIVHPNNDIMDRAATIRGNSIAAPPRFSLPDCIIRATAEASGRLIVTRNAADFGGVRPGVRVPYDIVDGVAVNIRPPPT